VTGAQPSSAPPFVSVVVPARNCETAVAACLSSLARVEYPRHRREIIVVDNASTDGTAGVVRDHPVTYLHEPRRGPAAARNHGVAASRGEIVAFIDADCVATPAWLHELVCAFGDTQVAGVAGEVVALNATSPAERYVAMRRPRLQEMVLARSPAYAGTANVAFRRQTFDRVGLFDPALRVGEDKDFGWRLARVGLRLGYAPRALVHHRHPNTAWQIFAQCAGWGYGHALVHRKHRPPWNVRRELPDAEIAPALKALASASARRVLGSGDGMSVWYPYLDLLRRVGLRLGAFYGSVIRS
jgi:cellulose synthase/poly-beta-1,6-N-acetylglucosamine synthase-like glycosyltransferase